MAGYSVSRSAQQYSSQLATLMPRGKLWDDLLKSDTTFMNLLNALSEIFADIETKAETLIDETDPRSVFELLYDWEQYVGLPDLCNTTALTIGQRRQELHTRLINDNGQSLSFFLDMAEKLGYVITITEFSPFEAGENTAGNAISNGDWVFVWQVNAPATTVSNFTAGHSAAGEAVRYWGNENLECVFNKMVHAHRQINYVYG